MKKRLSGSLAIQLICIWPEYPLKRIAKITNHIVVAANDSSKIVDEGGGTTR